jgi:hypothetical protein
MARDLSIIVPLYNAAHHIAPLVETALTADLNVEVLLVDDGSDDASADIVDELAEHHEHVHAFHQSNAGAGFARNVGFDHAAGRYTLFFDVDDELHADVLRPLVTALDRYGHDLAFTPYHYRRGHSEATNMHLEDLEVWESIMRGTGQRSVELSEVPNLLVFSNYPWNKLLRTSRYRSVGLRFGSTKVNNDILGHWYSLLFARSILLDQREICTHIVPAGGGNLTNQHGSVRLGMFDALHETYDLLSANPALRDRYSHFYWSLVLRVSSWARSRVDDNVALEFSAQVRELLMRIDVADYLRIRTRHDPGLADAINKAILQ